MEEKKNTYVMLSVLCFLFLSHGTSPSLSKSDHRCNSEDKKVLLQIKKAFGNPYHLASWDPKEDCCTWYCLQCDDNTGRVIDLFITQSEISGQIPPAVGNLPYLQSLTFHKVANLSGTIPESISKLTRLKFLRLSWTNLSGPVPAFLGQLKNLEILILNFNNLSGPIPTSLSGLPNLTGLRLDRNKLTGPIPDFFGNFNGSNFYLYLSHNQLTGHVPRSLGILNPPFIDLSRNKLQGDISLLFGADKQLQTADVSRNLFEFDLSNVVIPESLNYLDMNHNKIYGSIPKGFASSENLRGLNVSYNRLCGEIPVGGSLQTFGTTEYFHNKCLCGAPLPPCK